MSDACLLCKQPLIDGEKVVRVEIVHHAADGFMATREEIGGEYVHLNHLERAAIKAGPGPNAHSTIPARRHP